MPVSVHTVPGVPWLGVYVTDRAHELGPSNTWARAVLVPCGLAA
ncbi:hypothetical protein DWB77_03080 [Streptomyces hundungensis]|uniref:Uncharacterized protein n=1 Tax=Streptomyces hundungensis TaxID=1077946 RepID=A0A387HJD7_9ACTN|nr:hypothetical protein [Streptomyces hundungensis]AYG80942.1 hypothetical protein DWB77_03080 [Streptomyces hundungensis]